MGIKHKKRSILVDGTVPGEVHASDWNDDHDIDGVLGQFISLAPTPDSFPYIKTDGSGGIAMLSTPARTILAQATNALILAAIGALGAESPALTGVPTAPTAAPGTNTDQIATAAFVQAALAALVASSPAALNTLNELATAIGNDPNFAGTITTALGNRLRFDSVQGLTSPQKLQGQQNLGLGTAAPLDVGTAAGKVVQLDAAAKLPALDGSQLVNLPNGIAGAGYGGSSTTSLTPATGSKAFVAQTGLAYQVGSRVRATSASNSAVWMEGIVSSYSTGSLIINVDAIGTATAKTDWVFSIAGPTGAQGAAAPSYDGTSTTSLTPSVSAKVFATQAGLAYQVGARMRAASAATPTVWMEGVVTAYAGTSLTLNVDLIGAATAKADWNFSIAGAQGQPGLQGGQGAPGGQGVQGVQGPAGTFPIGSGVIGSFAIGVSGSGPLTNIGSTAGGSWLVASTDGTGNLTLFQRYA